MKIQSIKTMNKINFKGYGGSTDNVKANNSNLLDKCIHESHFMRDLESLEFCTEYITKNFPNGTHIADFGCSNGEETYSIAALLHKSTQDKKYKITGYDIIPSVVEDAKTGMFAVGYRQKVEGEIEEDKYEKFLVSMFEKLTPEQTIAKDAFNNCFEEVPGDWWHFNINDSRYKHKIKNNKYIKLKPNQDEDLIVKRLEALHRPNSRQLCGIKNVTPKEGIFDDVVTFKVADVAKINEFLKPKSTGVVVLKNSLYHLLGSRSKSKVENGKYINVDIKPAEIFFKKLHAILPENGIFFFGELTHDHLHDYSTSPSGQILQNGELIKINNTTPIHKALYKAGFEPIFYESMKTGRLNHQELTTHLPSVWRKVDSKSLVTNLVSTLKSLPKSIAKLF